MRNQAKELALNEKVRSNISGNDVERILGKPKYSNDLYKTVNMPGVAVGLA